MGAAHSSSRSGTAHGNHSYSAFSSSHKGRRSLSKDNLHNHRCNTQLHYPIPNNSGSALHHNNYLQPPSSPAYKCHGRSQHSKNHAPHHGSYSPPSSHTSHSSSLQKAFGRRRSSNQTVESLPSSLGSNVTSSYSGESSAGGPFEEREFRWLHGRRYHNTDSLYMLPNDTEEIDRLHLQHYIFKMLMGNKNIHVPFPKENGRIIDLGCGPATWTMDMATELTSVNFIGVDISPIFPTAIHPRNCSFYRENILRGISQPSNTFDVVYQRNVAPGFTVENWQQALDETYRLLKPGGWFESVESDVTVQDGGPYTKMCFELMQFSMISRNVDTSVVKILDGMMAKAGFVDIQVKEYCVPLGEWGGKMGQLWKQNLAAILETVKPNLVKTGKVEEAQVAEMVHTAMEKEMKEFRSYQTIYVTFGRKPIS
ncbi:S-adenosyl-L-methionine-dependent methyltransferase [Gamsiella multidivaricata]|uniref:S-adenosyl-L-methionine-dependent methyltransferase n=1 Tax=Gamsiella multidivaricata TaxID=101098 RepID=UPI0022202A8E|nr:S-adenosyl-L-methionine-dependent methyltransferase [Gamsiella multidivaricata]KAG0371086.1 hypothetical protein BGZ54_000534 [Gamsiella multidivaricata]KAI7829413.1 S-adenosyl-L-methionine-dependent methyltransferase [Gamsiella multidivaricata]